MIDTRDEGDKVTYRIKCRQCGKEFKIKLFPEDVENFNNGIHIQEAFPYISPEHRELLLTRTCPDCWDNMFKELDYIDIH